MNLSDTFLDWLGRKIAQKLGGPRPAAEPYVPTNLELLRKALRPGDVLLLGKRHVNRWSFPA